LLTASKDGAVRVWRLPRAEDGLDTLTHLSLLLTAHRIDRTGGIVPVELSELHATWQALR
jgi:hypothetical protein